MGEEDEGTSLVGARGAQHLEADTRTVLLGDTIAGQAALHTFATGAHTEGQAVVLAQNTPTAAQSIPARPAALALLQQ